MRSSCRTLSEPQHARQMHASERHCSTRTACRRRLRTPPTRLTPVLRKCIRHSAWLQVGEAHAARHMGIAQPLDAVALQHAADELIATLGLLRLERLQLAPAASTPQMGLQEGWQQVQEMAHVRLHSGCDAQHRASHPAAQNADPEPPIAVRMQL